MISKYSNLMSLNIGNDTKSELINFSRDLGDQDLFSISILYSHKNTLCLSTKRISFSLNISDFCSDKNIIIITFKYIL